MASDVHGEMVLAQPAPQKSDNLDKCVCVGGGGEEVKIVLKTLIVLFMLLDKTETNLC